MFLNSHKQLMKGTVGMHRNKTSMLYLFKNVNSSEQKELVIEN